MKPYLLVLFLFLGSMAFAADEVIYTLDFSAQPDGSALPWLKKQGFETKLGFEKLNPRFKGGALWLSTQQQEAGLCGLAFAKGRDLPQARRVRLTWGAATLPAGADFSQGVNRMALGVVISFGHENMLSGLPFGVGAEPYFLCPFLGLKEPAGCVYTGKYWKAGGRYVCVKSGKEGETLVTELDLNNLFESSFKKRPVPPVSGFAIQMNTKDTDGKASAFLRKIEFLRPGAPSTPAPTKPAKTAEPARKP